MNSVRYVAPKPPEGAQKRKVAVFRIKVDLSCKISMPLVLWHRQRWVESAMLAKVGSVYF